MEQESDFTQRRTLGQQGTRIDSLLRNRRMSPQPPICKCQHHIAPPATRSEVISDYKLCALPAPAGGILCQQSPCCFGSHLHLSLPHMTFDGSRIYMMSRIFFNAQWSRVAL